MVRMNLLVFRPRSHWLNEAFPNVSSVGLADIHQSNCCLNSRYSLVITQIYEGKAIRGEFAISLIYRIVIFTVSAYLNRMDLNNIWHPLVIMQIYECKAVSGEFAISLIYCIVIFSVPAYLNRRDLSNIWQNTHICSLVHRVRAIKKGKTKWKPL